MKYYPKSQIKTGLITKGNEFIISQTGEQYKGYYWGVSTGEFFSGKDPDDHPSFKLSPILNVNKNTLKIEQSTEIDTSNSYYIPDASYNSSKNIPLNAVASNGPKQTISLPLDEDKKNGYYMRYFLKKNNEYKYIELSQMDYLLYVNKSFTVPHELYTPISMRWELNKDNSYNVMYIENSQGWYGFTRYFKGKF